MSLDSSEQWAMVGAAIVGLHDRELGRVRRCCTSLQEGYGNSAWTLTLAGWMLSLAGDFDRGLAMVHEGTSFMHRFPGYIHTAAFFEAYYRRAHREALQHAERIQEPGLFWDPLLRSVACAELGLMEQAARAADELVTLRPDFTEQPERYLKCFITRNEWVEQIVSSLTKGGLFETV